MAGVNLTSLLKRRQLTIIGLNSGTSADGIDAAAVTIGRHAKRIRLRPVGSTTSRYPEDVRHKILELSEADRVDPNELVYLDTALGRLFGQTARRLIAKLARQNIKVHAVASHGQTVRHLPEPVRYLGRLTHGTFQVGSSDQIAAITGLPVIGDFRQAEVAVGGEGAPITTGAVRRLLAVKNRSRLLVNIGGISNLFYFPSGTSRLVERAIDCGPGNSLVDLVTQQLFGQTYDRGGRLASRGRLSPRLLCLMAPEMILPPGTVSTGREKFGRRLAATIIARARRLRLKKHDTLATTTELTAQAIARKVAPLLSRDIRLDELYLTGGGRHNKFLVYRLQELLPGRPILNIDDLGYDGDFLEAMSYAVMGEACLRSESLATGRQAKRPVSGHIVHPPGRSVTTRKVI